METLQKRPKCQLKKIWLYFGLLTHMWWGWLLIDNILLFQSTHSYVVGLTADRKFITTSLYSLICGGADVNPESFGPWFEGVGQSNVGAEHAVAGHGCAHHTRQDRARVQANAHLAEEKWALLIGFRLRVVNPFATDGTQKYRFKKFLIFIWEGRSSQIPMSDVTMRR